MSGSELRDQEQTLFETLNEHLDLLIDDLVRLRLSLDEIINALEVVYLDALGYDSPAIVDIREQIHEQIQSLARMRDSLDERD